MTTMEQDFSQAGPGVGVEPGAAARAAEPYDAEPATAEPEAASHDGAGRTAPWRQWGPPALLLVATAALYLIGLSRSGWANPYYSAAAQAASADWKAFFFGSLDASNFITVDKTPAALWLMGLSARVFGVNSFALLLPQALCGVAAVGLLYDTVRRWAGQAAGLIAGAVMATTPVAVMMFRFNNPDALLVVMLVLGAWALSRAMERGQTRWLLLAGGAVGFAYLAKMLQAVLVLPAFGLVYLLFGPPKLGRRLWQLAAAAGAMVAAAGWWVLIVELWPADSRPYIGGTQDNSILELTLGYNGVGRLTGEEVGSVGGAGGWGETGWLRLFGTDLGGQSTWLFPAALLLLAAGVYATWRRPRTDRVRAGFLLWGGWLLVTAAVFSFMAGIFHAYYTVALAPAIGALTGAGAVLLWRLREAAWARAVAALVVAGTGWWSYTLLGFSPDFVPWLRWAVLIGGLALGCLMPAATLLPATLRSVWARRAVVSLALAVGLAGPGAYALQTAASAHTGAIPTAGPAVTGGTGGFPGRGGNPGGFGGGPGGMRGQNGGVAPGQTGTAPGGSAPDGAAPNGTGQHSAGQNSAGQNGTGQAGGVTGQAGRGQRPGGTGGRGGMGGLLGASTPNAELKQALVADADRYDWVAATVGANNAAGLQLGTGLPVMAIGGFNGSDDAPSLAQFQQWVGQGRIHWFVGGSGFGAGSGSAVSAQIATWVTGHYQASTVGGQTVYDLTKQAS
ncbi:glycosyltransferase family 39 protein [Catellatospora vulcania]|uniref:glycosyltransferase family 39 protein n=1 Tax=Catellatospora vulcania TaxID=1460450 RepID=UPI0012D3E37B|nr:glycosyltransferase family 39 protein [Catellatospora vulcania]